MKNEYLDRYEGLHINKDLFIEKAKYTLAIYLGIIMNAQYFCDTRRKPFGQTNRL